VGLEQISAERAGGVVRGGEPLVEARRVELLLTGPASKVGQLVVRTMQNVEANVALLYTLKSFVHVLLPEVESLVDAAVLMDQEGRQSQHPLTPLASFYAHPLPRVYGESAQRIVVGEGYNQFHAPLVNGIRGNHLTDRRTYLEREVV